MSKIARTCLFDRGLALLALAVFLISAGASADEAPQTAVRQGIAVDLRIDPVAPAADHPPGLREGDTVHFRFQVQDTTTGTPLSGVYPAAWMDLRPISGEAEKATCEEKIAAFLSGSLLAQPELDLNVYYVVTLNQDATLSVVDPLFGFGTTKLLDMVFLDSPGEDWVLTPEQDVLFVSMPKVGQLAVVDVASWEVRQNLEVGPTPTRLALSPDGRYLWVGHLPGTDGTAGGVTVVDAGKPAVVQSVATGKGPHEIVIDPDSRYAFVANRGAGTLTVVDVATLAPLAQVTLEGTPVSLAYSSQARAAYVTLAEGGIVVVDGRSHAVVARMPTTPGLGQIKFAPGGRLGFVVHPADDTVHIVDVAENRIVQTADVEDEPYQLAFTDHLAYVRHLGSEIVLMIPVDQVGTEGRPVPVVDFTGGHAPFGRGSRPSPADGIVQAPGATAVLVANPADRAIYFYKEGMAAPMGHFQNYDREPRAVLTIDRSLQERAPGSYETIATLRRPGTYDIAFFLDAPRTFHCFGVEVASDPVRQAERARLQPVVIAPLAEPGVLAAGVATPLQFRLLDPVTRQPRTGLDDVRVLTFRPPGLAQERRPALETPGGSGIYQVDITPPAAGLYFLFVESPSLGLRFGGTHHLVFQANDPSGATVAAVD